MIRNRARALVALGLAALALSGCAQAPASSPDATPAQVAAAAYRHSGPPALTLYTMISNRSGSGAHSSLMINGSQRVIFDPAGTVRLKTVPEIGDVLYGVTPQVEEFYERAHARSTYHVRIQRLPVRAEVAELALRLAMQNGPVASAQCTRSTSALLARLPGFGGIKQTWFPNNLADQFAQLPGVTEEYLYEDDDDDKALAIAAFERQVQAGQ